MAARLAREPHASRRDTPPRPRARFRRCRAQISIYAINKIRAVAMMATEAQTAFVFRTWGGKRAGAGRPKKVGAGMSHLARPRLSRHRPVHVTVRVVRGLPSLRSRPLRRVLFRAFGAGSE